MKYYVVAGHNRDGDPVVLDTYKGWLVYGVGFVHGRPFHAVGRHFKSHTESKRAAAKAKRLFPTYTLAPLAMAVRP